MKPWSAALHDIPADAPDYRWAGPVHACLCGTEAVWLLAKFVDRQVGWYATDVRCASCGAYLIAPTEVDDGP